MSFQQSQQQLSPALSVAVARHYWVEATQDAAFYRLADLNNSRSSVRMLSKLTQLDRVTPRARVGVKLVVALAAVALPVMAFVAGGAVVAVGLTVVAGIGIGTCLGTMETTRDLKQRLDNLVHNYDEEDFKSSSSRSATSRSLEFVTDYINQRDALRGRVTSELSPKALVIAGLAVAGGVGVGAVIAATLAGGALAVAVFVPSLATTLSTRVFASYVEKRSVLKSGVLGPDLQDPKNKALIEALETGDLKEVGVHLREGGDKELAGLLDLAADRDEASLMLRLTQSPAFGPQAEANLPSWLVQDEYVAATRADLKRAEVAQAKPEGLGNPASVGIDFAAPRQFGTDPSGLGFADSL